MRFHPPWLVSAPRALLVLALMAGGVTAAGSCGEGEGDGDGDGDESEGEGDGEPGEGEGEARAGIAYRFERDDGSVIVDDVLDISTHGAGGAPSQLSLRLRNVGREDFSILSEPPLLLAGRDAAFFSVPLQPSAAVPAGGAVDFIVSYAPRTGGEHEAKLLFAWGVASDARVILTLRATAEGPASVPGVRYAVFDGIFDRLPDFGALGASETGVMDNFDISARVLGDHFAYLFEGTLDVARAGTWTFATTSDDGSRLLIDGSLVVDNDGLHGPLTRQGTVDLAAGSHAIRVEFFELAGGAALEVEAAPPGEALGPIADAALSTTP